MKGICGYGRYNDDPQHVGCPRAKSDMTPCIARDGRLALASKPFVCVGCGAYPAALLTELRQANVIQYPDPISPQEKSDKLRDVVREVTDELV